ncbi:protein kinase domain-containing protein [Streptomyces misionensis]|uniref:serine/threonine-protein kinase n=1 Tax=Streptomyces misionensis TaxID=67331 RepID=UPI00396BD886
MLDGRYRLIEPIGAGGFGQVWKAHDPKVDRLVAVKVLTGDGSADNDRQVARFAREAAVAGGLSHPNIVTVHDFGSALQNGRQYAYLVMELLRGKPLSVVLEGGRLPLPEVLRTAACVADALGTAHQAGLTHRDIKPSNIIVRPNGTATVVDFGITKSSDARHDITTSGVLIGTPAYMAPECFSGTFDHRSDLYSLGCVLYEMITGHRPFTGTSWHLINQHLHEQPAPLLKVRPVIPPELARLVKRLLAKNPDDRPADAFEVMLALREIDRRYYDEDSPSRGPDRYVRSAVTPRIAAHGAIKGLRLLDLNPCPACASRPSADICESCQGTGEVFVETTHRVRFPPGVRTGQRLRLKGLGWPGRNGGDAGDLFVVVRIEGEARSA